MCTATGAAARSEGLDRVRLHAALAGAGRELDPLALLQAAVTTVVGDRGEVHEHVVPAVVGLDEPEPLLRVEPAHGALRTAGRARCATATVVPPVVPTLGPGRAPRAAERGHRLGLRPALS